MFSAEHHRNYCWIFILLGLIPPVVSAEQKPASHSQSTVDIVVLKSGRTFRGLIAREEPKKSLTLIVSREWLVSSNPAAATTAIKENSDAQRAAWKQTRDRITERQKAGDESPGMAFFLQQEGQRLDRLLADPMPTELDFLWYEIRPAAISRVVRVGDDRRRIAAHAWNAKLKNVETRDVVSLRKELADRGINLELPIQELTDGLPARPQSDEEWAARMALLEYSMLDELNFQGMGDVLTRVKDGQVANLNELIPQLLQQQLKSLLNELGNDILSAEKSKDPSLSLWRTNAIRQAEKLQKRGFRVTRLEVDPVGSRIRVESNFIAQVVPGKWRTIWTMTEVEDGTKPRSQAEARIDEDPQMKRLKDSLDTLGLVDTESLKKAVRFGAATMSAQQHVDTNFAAFVEKYIRHLDRPPLPLFPTIAGDAE